jgi:hypothetical protein
MEQMEFTIFEFQFVLSLEDSHIHFSLYNIMESVWVRQVYVGLLLLYIYNHRRFLNQKPNALWTYC